MQNTNNMFSGAQMLLMSMLATSLILPGIESFVHKRSLFDTTTIITNNELTTVKLNEEINLAATTTISTDLANSTTTIVYDPTDSVVKEESKPVEVENNLISVSSPQTKEVDENNDIIIEDEATNKNSASSDTISTKFELINSGLTENLEDSIRNDVKNEIEMNQNQNTPAVLENISDPEIRQKLTEELRTYSQVKDEEEIGTTEANEAGINDLETTTLNNDIDKLNEVEETQTTYNILVSPVAITSKFEFSNSGLTENLEDSIGNENSIEINSTPSSPIIGEHNLESKTEENDSTNIQNEIDVTNYDIARDWNMNDDTKIESQNDLQALESSSLNTSQTVEGQAVNESENEMQKEEDDEVEDVQVAAGSENISVVLNETSIPTDALPAELPVETLENKENLKVLIKETLIDATTVLPAISSTHAIIKKQGVNLYDIADELVTTEVYIETSPANKQEPENLPPIVKQDIQSDEVKDEVENNENDSILEITTKATVDVNEEEENVNQDEKDVYETTVFDVIENENFDTTTSLIPENEEHLFNMETNGGLKGIAPIFQENINNMGSNKGSRSITKEHGYNDLATSAADNSHPPSNALNDKLNAESNLSSGSSWKTSYQSAMFIGFSAGISILFVIFLSLVFLVSFRRQHGTLDIELQEQRCGKDNLNDEETDLCGKLLDVELPVTPTVSTALNAEEDTDDCL